MKELSTPVCVDAGKLSVETACLFDLFMEAVVGPTVWKVLPLSSLYAFTVFFYIFYL